jgi:hypothetical protein
MVDGLCGISESDARPVRPACEIAGFVKVEGLELKNEAAEEDCNDLIMCRGGDVPAARCLASSM